MPRSRSTKRGGSRCRRWPWGSSGSPSCRGARWDHELLEQDVTIEARKTSEVSIALGGLGRLRTVVGRVVDRVGNPVAGAVMFQSGDGPSRTRTHSDDKGRFRLDGVDDGPAFVFARKPGFRFHGQLVETAAGPVTLTMTRSEGETAVAMRTRPSPLPHREELALARRVIDAYADKVLKEGDMSDKLRTLEALAGVEPRSRARGSREGEIPRSAPQ